jgi:hydroxymethylpyrimidine/phosphomethylpyrimidine kinase
MIKHPPDIPTVLSIAGSDPSGGAGIQADLKTFAATGVYGAAVITALTVQNTMQVASVMPIPADFVKQQIEAVVSDIRIDVIKLGMLPSGEICEAISPYLTDYIVVCDPVMISTSGGRLIDDIAVSALTSQIIPGSDYITPNSHELEQLTGSPVSYTETAGLELMDRFLNLKGIVLKGGHINTDATTVTDMLLYREGGQIKKVIETRPRYRTKNTHGTGCTFASAFASFIAQHNEATIAFSKAVSYTNRLIALSKDSSIGQGSGPLLHHAGIALKDYRFR